MMSSMTGVTVRSKESGAVNRTVLLVVVGLLVVVLGFSWWWQHRGNSEVIWQGYADADFIKVAPTQGGLLTSLAVARGDSVAAGALLFTQDEVPDKAVADQAAHLLEQSEAQLANLEAGSKTTEIEQARSSLTDMRASLALTKGDYVRGEALAAAGTLAPQDLEKLHADYLSAKAKVDAAEAALAQAIAPLGRKREIAAQRAAVDAARAALASAQWHLAQRRVVAPAAGRIADVIARPGETVAAGAPVVSLLPPENILVRFFVPENAFAGIHRGDSVGLTCDGCPSRLTATISFVSPQAEYTPPVIYSESSKAKLVFLVEARPEKSQATLLNPGQPVEVRPLARGSNQ